MVETLWGPLEDGPAEFGGRESVAREGAVRAQPADRTASTEGSNRTASFQMIGQPTTDKPTTGEPTTGELAGKTDEPGNAGALAAQLPTEGDCGVALERTLGWVTEAQRGHKAGDPPRTLAARATRFGAAAAVAVALHVVATPLAAAEPNPWYQAGRAAIERMHAERPATNRAKNVILFIGDGMSITTVTAARILEGQLAGDPGEENWLSFERFDHVALSKTYNTNQQVPDSAGTMTAMVSGIKTKAGLIGVDESVTRGDHSQVPSGRIPSLFELAEARGLATGVVTTTRLTHATPASCYAHSPERNWENDGKLSPAARDAGFPDLALQLLDFPNSSAHPTSPHPSDRGDGLEVALGGGRLDFLSAAGGAEIADPDAPTMGLGSRLDGRNLIAEWRSRRSDAVYVSNTRELEAVDPAKTQRLLGLFEGSHMSFHVDRDKGPEGEPSLAQMTAKAIEILSQRAAGFVLVVEGGRIDHAHHVNNAYRALTDTIALSDAVQTAVDMTDRSETLIVTTADHSHTLTMSGYPVRGNDILGLVRGNNSQGEPASVFTRDQLGKPYTALNYANGPGYTGKSDKQPEGPKTVPHVAKSVEGIKLGRPDLHEVATHGANYMQEATFPLGYETHAGEDVAIYAQGPSAWLFAGVVEQNYIFHALTEALGWNGEPNGSATAETGD